MRPACKIVLALLFYSNIVFLTKSSQLPQDIEDGDFWQRKGQSALRKILGVKRNTKVAKNVVLIIGDGMGISTVTAARIRKGQLRGKSGEETVLNMDRFPSVGLSKVYTTDRQVPDSAGTATAYLSGVKTKFAVLGVDTKTNFGDCKSSRGREVDSILDWSLKAGKSVGIVTTAAITHASPAAAYAHAASRLWEADSDMVNVTGRCKDIARQLVEDNPNIQVLLGGGRTAFLPKGTPDKETGAPNELHPRLDGRNLINEWKQDKRDRRLKHKFVWNKRQFDHINPHKIDYLLGLFENSHMQDELVRDDSPQGEPSITEMTEKAIQILSKNPKGFFLFVEGAKIDINHHQNFAKRALHETIALDAAVKKTVDMLDERNSLVVVSADHSHTLVMNGFPSRGNPILGTSDSNRFFPTLDGKPYTTLGYGNGPGFNVSEFAKSGGRPDITGVDIEGNDYRQQSAVPLSLSTHGGEDVAILARGPMAHLFQGVHEQNYIAHAMAYASCVGVNQDHCKSQKSRRIHKFKVSRRKLRNMCQQAFGNINIGIKY